MMLNVFAAWQVAAACGVYAAVVWLMQLYRVVPPRDWLAERLAEDRVRIHSEEWSVGNEGRTHLQNIQESIKRFWLLLPTSKVQAGWRQVHAMEDNHLLELDHSQVDESLKTLKTRLGGIKRPGSSDLATRIEHALRSGNGLEAKRALLREAAIFRHNISDTDYEDLASLLAKAVWLTFVTLALVAGLAAAFDRDVYFLLGAAGGLTSRLTRVLRRRPSASDYGAVWSSLLLSPAAGALFGWIGVLLLAALSTSPLNILNGAFADPWTKPSVIGLAAAFLFGFSERLMERVLGRAQGALEAQFDEKKT